MDKPSRWDDNFGVTEIAYMLMRLLRRPNGSAAVRAVCTGILEQCDIADEQYDGDRASRVAQDALAAAHGRLEGDAHG